MIIQQTHLKDTFDSYWTVDDRRTYSKLEAIMWANGDPARIKYHWMENTWDRADFSKEPETSWEDLCMIRARQIREQHDWVCLWFSGGYDSMQMLHSFIKSGCKIDEIAFIDWSHFYDDGELPTAKKIADWYRVNHNSNVRITNADIDYQHTSDWFRDNPNWITHPGDTIRFARPYLGIRVEANKTIRDHRSNQRRAEVMGLEKPKMDIYNGMWRTFMSDTTMANSAGADLVQFYCSDDLPELHIKQVYMAIRFFESNDLDQHKMVHAVQSWEPVRGHIWYREWNLALGRREPQNYETAIGSQKVSNPPTVLAPMDRKLYQHALKSQDKGYQNYVAGINELKQFIPWWDPTTTGITKFNLPSKFYDVIPVRQHRMVERV